MRHLFIFLIASLITSLAFAETTPLACPEFPFFQPKTGPLALVNCDFHHSYEDRIKEIEKTFGAVNGRPIIMNLGGTLIFKYNGKTQTAEITPPAYHNIKAYTHAAFAVYLLLSQNQSQVLDPATIIKLQNLQKDLQQALLILPTLNLETSAKAVILKIVNITNHLLNKILMQRSWSNQELKVYYQEITPSLNQAIMLTAAIELQTLDQIMNKWLSEMKPEEIKKLGIIVALPHQPRAQEISLQYFAKRFGYHFGEGALYENGLVVLEGQYDEKAAFSLLARHYLDREAALMIFDNPERLQRDLLADAARSILQTK